MRTNQYLLSTLRETPADAVVIDHQLLLRTGMIRRLTSGLYTWLPVGLRVLRKIETIICEEMNATSVLEVLMSAVQPAELWQGSGRWEQYGPELLCLKDCYEREFCVDPVHEEVITDLARNEPNSYKQLPISFYQIRTKFRDGTRPRFNLVCEREFIMKDAYSFHLNQYSLQQTYDGMHQACSKIFSRLGLNFHPAQADDDSIGGSDSHKFHILADSGGDDIVFSGSSDYVANIEKTGAVPCENTRDSVTEDMRLVDTPNTKTTAALMDGFQLSIEKAIKTLVVCGVEEGTLVVLIVRGDHELNEIKAANQSLVASPLVFTSEAEIHAATGAGPGSLGPVNLPIVCIVDRPVALMSDFATGTSIEDKRYFGVNWERDLPLPEVADLRNAVEGDPSLDGKGTLVTKRSIEVGHISQPGTKYSEVMKLDVLSEQDKPVNLIMGRYGIGVSRVVTTVIKQNHDRRGILWLGTLAPSQITLVPLRHETESIKQATDRLYVELTAADFEVLLDDHGKRTNPGAKFADMGLIGIPHCIVINNRGFNKGVLEYEGRRDSRSQNPPTGELMSFITEKLSRRA